MEVPRLNLANPAFKLSKFARALYEIEFENEVFLRMIQRVRHGLEETERLARVEVVNALLVRNPVKTPWIRGVIDNSKDVLNETEHWVAHSASGDQTDSETITFEGRMRRALRDREGMVARKMELATCRQDLSTVLAYLTPLEPMAPSAASNPVNYTHTKFSGDFLSLHQEKKSRHGAEKRSSVEIMDRETSNKNRFNGNVIQSGLLRATQGQDTRKEGFQYGSLLVNPSTFSPPNTNTPNLLSSEPSEVLGMELDNNFIAENTLTAGTPVDLSEESRPERSSHSSIWRDPGNSQSKLTAPSLSRRQQPHMRRNISQKSCQRRASWPVCALNAATEESHPLSRSQSPIHQVSSDTQASLTAMAPIYEDCGQSLQSYDDQHPLPSPSHPLTETESWADSDLQTQTRYQTLSDPGNSFRSSNDAISMKTATSSLSSISLSYQQLLSPTTSAFVESDRTAQLETTAKKEEILFSRETTAVRRRRHQKSILDFIANGN